MIELSWDEVRRRRLWRHSLLQRAPAGRLLSVVSDVCGIHAQIMPAAELSIGIRTDQTRSGIRAALWEERCLVKTYGIRGTLHLFPATELPLWMAAARARHARSTRREARRLEYLGLEAGQVRLLVDAMADALDGRAHTLRELGQEVVRRTGDWAAETRNEAWVSGWPNWRTALGTAAAAGKLCFGQNRGNEVTFVRPDQWLGTWHDMEPDQALQEVFKRYLLAYGPATHTQFATWFSLPPAAARDLAGSLREELGEVRVEGKPFLLPAADAELNFPSTAAPVRLLPHFDCYLRGFHPREQLVDGHAERAAGGTGRFPILLVDGAVAGVWERRPQGRRLEVRVEPYQRLTSEQLGELEQEVARIGAILEAESRLVLGPVEVRPHW